jgi:PleD family two-component response regulator
VIRCPRSGSAQRNSWHGWTQADDKAKKLLVNDDEAGIAKVIGLIAEQQGLDVKLVSDPALETETFLEFRPDIVILDMIMPERMESMCWGRSC